MNVALYIRLSKADQDTGFKKAESESIVNQRNYINDFLDRQSTLSSYNRREFIDDGFSGIKDDRPSLLKMMEAVKDGDIDVICVKDFSRFFRDYIEAGNYLECVFPFLNVRFISINDNYDSDNFKGTTGGMEMVMRNIVYAAYSKDLSIKVSSGKRQKLKQGKFTGSHAPFGYKKSETDKNKLVIDEYSGRIVRRIFDLVLDGKTTTEIARILSAEGLPTKGQYYKMRYPHDKKHNTMLESATWNATKVHSIIRSRVYVGDLVGCARRKVSYNSSQKVRQEPIIIANTHEGIVTREEFETAGAMIATLKTSKKREYQEYPLRGLLRCGSCKYLLGRHSVNKQFVFRCHNAVTRSNEHCPVCGDLEEGYIEQIVFGAIKQFIALAESGKVTSDKPKDSVTLQDATSRLEGLKQAKLRIYEKYTSDLLSKEEYLAQKNDMSKKIDHAESVRAELLKAQTKVISSPERLKADVSAYLVAEKLTKEMAQAFVSEVFVHSIDRIEVKMKYQDLFE